MTAILYLAWGLIVVITAYCVLAVLHNTVRDEIERHRARTRRRTAYHRDELEQRRHEARRRIGGRL